ncbi:hypothetical protein H4S02_003496, partial [Coemansia sp. RSA 2611]
THTSLGLERPVTRAPSIGITLRARRRTAEAQLAVSLKADEIREPGAASTPVRRRTVRHSRSFGNSGHSPPHEYPAFSMDAFGDSMVPATPPSTAGPYSGGMLSLPASDPRHGSRTMAARGNEQRRIRGQRRKTDSSEEPPRIQRPATAHATTTSRKVTYSQYPDFETIKDPFAKRDKIPRRSEHPFALDPAVAAKVPPVPVSPASNERGARGGGSHTEPPTPVSAPIPHLEDHAVPAASASRAPAAGAQLSVPTPQRTREYARDVPEPLQMEALDGQFPESPVTPTQQVAAAKPRNAERPPLPAAATLLLSPISPVSRARMGREAGSAMVTPQRNASRPGTIEMAALKSPARTVSGHSISPRLKIDMNQVDKLYARRSLIFENRAKRENRVQSPLAATPEGAVPTRVESLPQWPGISTVDGTAVTAKRQSYSSDYSNYDDDEDSADYIPFEQVLIPTAFKRLRAALEDPAFGVDEETYRRFKLSERWYAREERRQTDRATGGAKQDRNTAAPAAPAEIAAEDSGPYAEPAPLAIPARVRTASKQRTRHDSMLDVQQSHSDDNDHRMSGVTALATPAQTHRSTHGKGYVPPSTPQARYPESRDHGAHELQDLGARKHRDRRQKTRAVPAAAEQPSSACCGCTIM